MDESSRKEGVVITRKQLGLGGGFIGLLIALNPVKEWFYTREEGLAQNERLIRIETLINKTQEDSATAHRDLLSAIRTSYVDVTKHLDELKYGIDRDNDRQEARIDKLEEAMLIFKRK
jgi:hypothetical protein